jgi:hypothetical protein
MTKGTTVGCMAVVAGVLLATMTSVSAFHTATGKGTYGVDSQILAEFHFVVAKPRDTNPDLKPGLNFVQSEVARISGSKSFQTVMISTAIAPLDIPPEPAERTVTINGEMVSTIFLGAGEERQHFAEFVSFTAIGIDEQTSKPDSEHFSLTVEYSTSQKQGPLFKSLGFGDCVGETCIITFEGRVKKGDIFVRTSGGD